MKVSPIKDKDVYTEDHAPSSYILYATFPSSPDPLVACYICPGKMRIILYVTEA